MIEPKSLISGSILAIETPKASPVTSNTTAMGTQQSHQTATGVSSRVEAWFSPILRRNPGVACDRCWHNATSGSTRLVDAIFCLKTRVSSTIDEEMG